MIEPAKPWEPLLFKWFLFLVFLILSTGAYLAYTLLSDDPSPVSEAQVEQVVAEPAAPAPVAQPQRPSENGKPAPVSNKQVASTTFSCGGSALHFEISDSPGSLRIAAKALEDWEPAVTVTVRGDGDSCLKFSRSFSKTAESNSRVEYSLSLSKDMISTKGTSAVLTLTGHSPSNSAYCKEEAAYTFAHPVRETGFAGIRDALHPGMRAHNLCKATY